MEKPAGRTDLLSEDQEAVAERVPRGDDHPAVPVT